MRKVLFLLATFFLGDNIIICKNNDSNNVAELHAKVESTELSKQVELGQKELAEAEWDEFRTNDLNAFNLKGHVKTVTYLAEHGYEYFQKLQFSIDGKLEQVIDGVLKQKYIIKRNKKGQITDLILQDSWDGGDEGECFRYDASGYLCYHCIWCSDTMEDYYTRTNEDHWPTRGIRQGDGEVPITFSYPTVDRHGNWTSRKKTYRYSEVWDNGKDSQEVIKRTITYYEYN